MNEAFYNYAICNYLRVWPDLRFLFWIQIAKWKERVRARHGKGYAIVRSLKTDLGNSVMHHQHPNSVYNISYIYLEDEPTKAANTKLEITLEYKQTTETSIIRVNRLAAVLLQLEIYKKYSVNNANMRQFFKIWVCLCV